MIVVIDRRQGLLCIVAQISHYALNTGREGFNLFLHQRFHGVQNGRVYKSFFKPRSIWDLADADHRSVEEEQRTF